VTSVSVELSTASEEQNNPIRDDGQSYNHETRIRDSSLDISESIALMVYGTRATDTGIYEL
jgi:hypothetical protein